MSKKFSGNKPNKKDGWVEVGKCFFDSFGWTVFKMTKANNSGWSFFKISADEKVAVKANYRFSKNSETAEIGFKRDYLLLESGRPGLLSEVSKFL
ncbi:MAG: hypothetical protein IPM37_23195 [Hahellaceae bacterium]|nr:hypothetical protein [Hahellaceae bacterium]